MNCWCVRVSLPILLFAGTVAAAPHPHRPQFEDHWIRDQGAGLRLYVRHLPGRKSPSEPSKKPVLFVHGASFPSGLAAGYRFDGYSWMDQLADRGYDVWALDFAGYGKSDRYPEMERPAESGPPLGRADTCSRQLAAAVEYIRQRTRSSRVSLVAHSWGTIVAGVYASENPDKIDRLVLFGPVAARAGVAGADQSLLAWTCVSVEDQRERFFGYVPRGESAVIPRAQFDEWGRAYLDSDPTAVRRGGTCVKVPNGPSADIASAWSGQLPYDPARIRNPTLIVRGEWETVTRNVDAARLYGSLTAASPRRDVLIDKGTHVMHLEASRFQLYAEVAAFLDGEASRETRKRESK